MGTATTSAGGDRRSFGAGPDLRVYARALSYLYSSGAVLLAVLVVLPHESIENQTGLLAVAVIAGGIGLFLHVAQPILPVWSFHVTLAAATVLVSACVHFNEDGRSVFALYYLWVGIYAFYFFTGRQVAAHVAWVGVAYGAMLAWDVPVPDGERVWVMLMATIVVLGLFMARLVHQVRERAAEAAARAGRLREAERRTRLILDSAGEGYVATDAEGTITDVNSSLEELTGWSRADLLGRPVTEKLLPERWHAAFEEGLRRFRQTGEDAVFERRVEVSTRRREGDEFPVELTITPLADDDRWTFHGFVHDITERKAVERQMREQVEDLGVIADVARDLAGVTDAHAARPAICKAARELAGAKVGILLEPDARGQELVSTAIVGAPVPTIRLPFAGTPSGAGAAFTSNQSVFVADLADNPTVSQRTTQQLGVASALWQPVVRNDVPIGVLTVAWEERMDHLTPRVCSLMELLAAETAVAIERADLLARLEAVARTDDLTGLANRRAWEEHLPRELARAGREDYPVCIAMFDLDRFKAYNDAHGHQAGDRLLKQVTAAWREALRPSDVLARYGGEEFVLLLPNCPMGQALTVVDRLREEAVAGQTCSAGLACWDGEESASALVARADEALYEAKRAGRDRAVAAT